MSSKDKWVRRFSVDETAKHKNGFTIYKITSVLFPKDSPEAVTAVSVWKRYSDVQRLHKSMRALHAGLHLRGTFPPLPKYSYFKRFHKEVITERAHTTKALLEFVAEHRLLFTSTDFVNFLQTGYPEPQGGGSVSGVGGVINAIRSSLHLPIEETPPLEYQTDDDDARTPTHSATTEHRPQTIDADETDYISQIPIYEAADVEIRQTPDEPRISDSLESLNSLESIDSDLYDELSKVSIDKDATAVRRTLPDLIVFDAPSTSSLEEGQATPSLPDTDSITSTSCVGAVGASAGSSPCAGYVFEAAGWLHAAARHHDVRDYPQAFHCYKAGIERMLRGVQTDPDPQRRALIKEKTNKYLSYAEAIYNNHLRDVEEPHETDSAGGWCGAVPARLLRRSSVELQHFRLLAALGRRHMLVLHREQNKCYAIKVVQKIPNNLTEFDEYFLQKTNETRELILPTDIPYMVTLHSYIETENLFFLILSYAPGEKLFDYIRRYARTTPNTPAREANLENVFHEPKYADLQNENLPETKTVNNNTKDNDEVTELVQNSQKLLRNVDRALSGPSCDDPECAGSKEEVRVNVKDKDLNKNNGETAASEQIEVQPRDVIPPSAVCKWAAEILIALESLHNCGVIWGDLSLSDVLLGSGGHALLTYCARHVGVPVTSRNTSPTRCRLHVAPELTQWRAHSDTHSDTVSDTVSRAADCWSYGALLYALLTGTPLCHYHRSGFTSHTILHIPEGLTVEEESILTQLLTYSPSDRLGAGPEGMEEIKRHPYFKHIQWQQLTRAWTPPD